MNFLAILHDTEILQQSLLTLFHFRIIPHTDEANYVHINTDTTGCSSYLGMVGGEQSINFAAACSWGNLAHEFMHALGKPIVC